MNIQFYKYQGTGNDFILIDNQNGQFDRTNTNLVKQLCDRRFGIGADGLMLLQEHPDYHFEMVYYNSDGYEGSMCGNGGRCIVAFAHFLGVINTECKFIATDGEHEAQVINPDYIRLKMIDVNDIEINGSYYFLDTGSPHYVSFCTNLKKKDVFTDGRAIRYNERFNAEGTNVNFVEQFDDYLMVRTYERGVENETFSCGTGIVASAISAAVKNNNSENSFNIKALGGELKVSFDPIENNQVKNVWLEGKATQVFQGTVEI